MATYDKHEEGVEFKLALLDSSSDKLFMMHEHRGFHLPRVTIPKWTRVAEAINDAARNQWQLNTLVLDFLCSRSTEPTCAVLELTTPSFVAATSELERRHLGDLNELDLDTEQRRHLCRLIDRAPLSSGPFSRRGWLQEAKAWIKTSLPGQGLQFRNEVRQCNASATFALVRLDTEDGRSYWLKATGEPNRHECSLVVELSGLFPDLVPSLVAFREDWNAWVAEDAGNPLDSSRDLAVVILAVETLAELQIRSLDHISRLQSAGCMDRRLSNVLADLPQMLAFLEEAMEHQTSTRVQPLGPPRLHEIGLVVEEACRRFDSLGIPDALVNGDINLDNILFDGTRIRFTDWAEAGIGNPFLTLQQVIQHVIRFGEYQEWESHIAEAYLTKWRSLCSEMQIDSARAFMPLITMVDYLHGRGDWLRSERRKNPTFQSFARTVARSMDRAAAKLSMSGALSL